MKIIPVYLPQFHQIPENDEWWGEGFTEWTNVKGAKPLFDGHYQPREPLDDNYYDLSEVETIKWQCKLAREYGVYGFCMYHYWVNGKLLLHKPMEILLAHPEIDINYCVSWANHDWTDGWKASNKSPKILLAHNFDDEQDWVEHFNYLLPFFKDSRYISENNKPYMIIYIPNIIGKLNKMLALWDKLAQDAGFDGLTFIYQSAMSSFDTTWDRSKFKYGIETNPGYVNNFFGNNSGLKYRLMKYSHMVKKLFGIKRSLLPSSNVTEVGKLDYDAVWENILKLRPKQDNMIPSAFTDWDNTPRHKERGYVYVGASPKKFESYLRRLIENAKLYYPTDMIFIFAWNEWAEGGYLEPDKQYRYGYLEAIRNCIDTK
ncbi:MAG: glycoside hydrolase family 99-like domain-containing protein [bacterium]